MSNRLEDVLHGKEDNYILPFFWLHGEEESVLRECIQKVEEAGIRALCIESRPYPDFVGDSWWRDFDIILDEVKKREMKIWILDDSHFPTGYANGAVKDVEPRLKKWHLSCSTRDVKGPLKDRKHPVAVLLGVKVDTTTGSMETFEEELVTVLADKRINGNVHDTEGNFIDLTDKVKNGYLYWDVPEGEYRIFTITKRLNACSSNNDYINLLEKDSVRLLVDAVYEPHYKHYKEEFGKTIKGFFSDEPGFYNSPGAQFDFNLKLGNPLLPIPWADHMLKSFSEELGYDAKMILPALWYQAGENTDNIRYHYMNLITRLYSENFTQLLGCWCKERNVEYIGHVLEDGNVHSRLGSGAGHYFRAMKGQHMAGIDVVMNQVVPGNNYGFSNMLNPGQLTDGVFNHYGLAKLGVSAAHQYPEMNGRCMCEIFGAYGWSEGITLMKWLTDHMLVRGVNQFAPHAFSPKEFPDQDCPPHFYARGNNPQYPYMRYLFNYMNRMSHLLNGGKSGVRIGVLYHGEGDWVGDAMTFQTVGMQLMQNQMDYDVISMDVLAESNVRDNKLFAGSATYECLIVPDVKKISVEHINILNQCANSGLPVYYIDQKPKSINPNISSELVGEVHGLEDICGKMKDEQLYEIIVAENLPDLRYYQYQQEDFTIHMFFNEHISENVETLVTLRSPQKIYCYDAFDNNMKDVKMDSEHKSFILSLEAGESIVYTTKYEGMLKKDYCSEMDHEIDLKTWKISLENYNEKGKWSVLDEKAELKDISELSPLFSGTIRYECDVTLNDIKQMILQIDNVIEAVEVVINGKNAGVRISAPYEYNITEHLQKGKNHIQINLATTLFYSQRDLLSLLAATEPMGIIGSVKLM